MVEQKWKAKRWFGTDKWIVVKGRVRYTRKKNGERKVVMFKTRTNAANFAKNLNNR